MKQKIKSYPPIQWILDNKIPDEAMFQTTIGLDPITTSQVKKLFKATCKTLHDKSIMVCTQPFINAIAETSERLMKDDIWNTEFEAQGIMVLPSLIYVYKIKANKSGKHNYEYMAFSHEGNFLVYNSQVDELNRKEAVYNKLIQMGDEIVNATFSMLMCILLFTKFATIETKELQPRQKVHFQNCKYFNDTDNRIILMDCTWYTNLIKTEAFKVRPHFRLQAYGPKWSLHRLIWIGEQEREKYEKPAKMLKESII